MSIQLLQDALSEGVLLYLEEGRLKARGAARALTDQFRQRIAANKSELTALLQKAQTRVLTEATLREHEAYWLRQLSGAPPLHGLPLHAVRGEGAAAIDAHHAQELDADLTRALLIATEERGASQFEWLYTAVCVVLARWSGEDDIVIGTSLMASGAHNVVALRADAAGDPSFLDLLERCQEVVRQAQAHAIVPFGWVVHELGAGGPRHASPLFQISMQMGEHTDAWPASDLQLSIVSSAGRLQVRWAYAGELFAPATVERLSQGLESALRESMREPTARIWKMPLTNDHDRQQVRRWNATEAEYQHDACIHHLFESQAAAADSAPAVICGSQRLSYGQLNARANSVAHALRARGLGRGDLVGVCVERSVAWIVGALAVLKAGGAYVPLDPSYPPERLHFMLDDCGAREVLAHSATRDKLPSTHTPILLDHARVYTANSACNPAVAVTPNDLAYVIYTSGSTGEPKGVLLQHGATINLHANQRRLFAIRPGSRVLAFASIGFDAATWEWIMALLAGASLYICEDDQRRSASELSDYLIGKAITHALIPPALLPHVAVERDYALQCLMLAGEACDTDTAWRWAQRYPTFNAYGPSETTVCASVDRVRAGEPITIGAALDNVRLYVADERQALLPIDCPGELLIGGVGLARGYLGRPALTQERFVERAVDGGTAQRLYRTGDRVRARPDGRVEFLGRLDDQVKIRGYRVELSEIEARLGSMNGVREAAVLARGEGQSKRLVAYVAATDTTPAANEFRTLLEQALAAVLPDYMLPSAFVFLERLPVTTNGKIDRRALAQLDVGTDPRRTAYVPPENELQAKLCEIWQDLLKLERIGIEDGFFASGGDSILALQAVARANQAAIAMTTRQLYELQTVAAITQQLRDTGSGTAGTVNPGPATGIALLSPIQQEFLDGTEEDLHQFTQSVLLEAPSAFDAVMLKPIVRALYERHDSLRLRFHSQEGNWQARFADLDPALVEASCAVEMLPNDSTAWREHLKFRCDSYQRSLDLAAGPLLKVVYFAPAEPGQRGRLFLTAHHLGVDAVSWRILLADLQRGYEQVRQGQNIALARRSASVQQWAARLHEYAQSEEVRAEKEYWLRQFTDQVSRLPKDRVPTDAPRQASTRYLTLSLTADASKALVRECSKPYRTRIEELLLAVVYVAVRRWCGSRTLQLMIEGHGRQAPFEDVDVSETVGWFTSTQPLLLGAPNDAIAEIIMAVKEQRRPMPGHGQGYGLLRHTSSDPELVAAEMHAGKPELLFNYLGQFDAATSADGDAFALVDGEMGANISPRHARMYALGLNGVVSGGVLSFTLDYSSDEYDDASMQRLLQSLEQGFAEVIEHCTLASPVWTPSDFPLARVTQSQLDEWQRRYSMVRLYPATPMQQGMLFHSLLQSSAYVTQLYPIFTGPLDTRCFRRAWQAVIDRHDMFRSVFVGQGEQLHQLVVEQAQLPWHEEDWRALSPGQQSERFERYRQQDRDRGFRMEEAPLQRISVFRLGDERYQLLWSHHHMVLDGWCLPLVYRDVMEAYQALLHGESVRWAPSPPYEHYIGWLQKQNPQQARTYWREQLAQIEAATPLSIDKLPTEGGSGHRVQELTLGDEQTRRLQSLAQTHQTTLSTVLQLAWGYLLHRYSSESQVVFGAIIAGRPAEVPGVEQMVGLFINAIAVRVAFDEPLTIGQALGRLHERFRDSQRYGYLPLTQVQSQSQVRAGTPLFDSLMVFENYPLEAALQAQGLGGISIEGFGAHDETHYKLTLSAGVMGRRLSVRCQYHAEDFAAPTIERLLGHLGRILRELPDCDRIDTLDILEEAERGQLQLWSQVTAQYPQGDCLHELFEAQVHRTPHAPAVRYEQHALTYEKLNHRANQLAHELIARGVRADTLVGLCVERSVEMLVGIIGILKAGGAYVPLDPSYPEERLRYMIEDSAAAVVVTQTHLRERLPLPARQRALLLDAAEAFAERSVENPGTRALGLNTKHLAYVIYTSGSTGRPKGVMIEHRSVVNLAYNIEELARKLLNGAALRSWGLQASYAFDASLQAITQLAFGCCVCVISEECRRNPAVLGQYLQSTGLDILDCTPSLVESWFAGGLDAQLPALLIGGEAITPALWKRLIEWQNKLQRRAINVYGPTECCVDCTWTLVTGDRTRIGAPLNNFKLYVASSQMQMLPIGCAGELLVGGAGLARGYWNREAQTSEKFITVSKADGSQERLYRTGDRVRLLPDGGLEYLGRFDAQVKVRGFRIELGEIEASLLRQDAVRESVVIVAGDAGQSQRLVAYVVPAVSADSPHLVEVLQSALARELPDYMVPASFVVMEALPLTAHGKVDRRALPPVDFAAQIEASYTAPRDEPEQKLCRIWQELLKLERVGIDDAFFAIGGDSILAIQAVARANRAGISITTLQLYQLQTIAALARVHREHLGELSVEAVAVAGNLELLPVQRRFLLEAGTDRHHFNHAICLSVPPDFSESLLRSWVDALYQRHDALRLRFEQCDADEWSATYAPISPQFAAASVAVEELPEAIERRAEHIRALSDEYQRSFDLATGPLFRAIYFAAEQGGRLLLLAHHLIVDGVSWRIVLADLQQAYRQWRAGESVRLAVNRTSLQRWGERLAQYARSHELAVERAYWLAQVEHSSEASVAPTYGTTKFQTLRLSEAQTQRLLKSCSRAYRTRVNELLLAAVFTAMRRWHGGTVVRMAMEGHGRDSPFEDLNVGETMGWFTSIYPLALRCEHESLAEVIKAVKEQCRAVPHGGIGYGVLRHIARDPEIVTAAPSDRPQLLFNYLGRFDEASSEQTGFELLEQDTGVGVSARSRRCHRLGLNGVVSGGVLSFTLDYSSDEYDDASMQRLLQSLEQGFAEVIEHCTLASPVWTPSDFPLARVTQSQLDEWQRRYSMVRLYPATPMQQGMLFHSLLQSSAYVTQLYPIFTGPLDTRCFRRAWQAVIDRHDMFRSVFVGQGEQLHQLVVEQAQLPWHEEDWRALSPGQQSERFERYRQQDRDRGFRMEEAPLQRISVFRLGDERYQLLWSHHHMVLDGWCLPLVYRDVMEAYQALLHGESVRWAPSPPYEHYIGWLQKQNPQQARTYWREQLAQIEAATPLSIDKLPTEGGSGHRVQELTLGDEQTRRLQSLAQTHQTTLSTVLQLAWGYLLHRYSSESQVVFGAIIAGRPAEVPGVEQMVGLFINAIAVRVAFDEPLTIGQALGRLHERFRDSQRYGYLPLTQVQSQSQVRAGTPLFDSLMVFENYPLEAALQAQGLGGISIEGFGAHDETHYKLTLSAGVMGRRLSVRCQYHAEDFAAPTIERLLGHLGRILRELPDCDRIDTLDILEEAERGQLQLWSQVTAQYPQGDCLHELFEAQVHRTPHAPAVRYEQHALTYEKLNHRANQLAHELIARGVRADTLVGLCVERSVEMLVGIIGILKAGGAYVPLDPSYPEERLRYMIEDSAAAVVVTQTHLRERLPLPARQRALLLDAAEAFAERSVENPGTRALGLNTKHLAYVIYTSGSTGRPKGVMIEHRSVVASTLSRLDYYRDPVGVYLLLSSVSFDSSVAGIFWTLATGGELCLPSSRELDDHDLLLDLCERAAVTHLLCVPSLYGYLLDAMSRRDTRCPAKVVIVAGEPVSPAVIAAHRSQPSGGECQLYNEYGPTECAVWSCVFRCDDVFTSATVPIGRAPAHAALHVLDSHKRVVPIGVTGEFFIGGAQARGYLNLPDMSAQRFITLEIDGRSQRLYASGDLVRRLPDGNLEFVGRVDNQEKVRGFRVELGEIEAVLCRSPLVREAVTVVQGEGGDRYIAAYFVPAMPPTEVGQETAWIHEVHRELRRSLPAHMVPRGVAMLAALPVTPNGKIDRHALPSLQFSSTEDYVAPADGTESELAKLWRELLELDRLPGANANFFELGGHSLLATRLVSAARTLFDVELSLAQLLANPTLRDAASLIDASRVASRNQRELAEHAELHEMDW